MNTYPVSSSEGTWSPSCTTEKLHARAGLLAGIREFFAERGVLEVETPLLCRHTVTDPHLTPFQSRFGPIDSGRTLFLQTSPEFAMKRLLAAGSGSIYQVCKAFRNDELGRWHAPEFTLLEWYRVGFGLNDLIAEVDALLDRLIGHHTALAPAERLGYRELFARHVGADPIAADFGELDRCARRLGLPEASDVCGLERSTWLDLLFSHAVQPHLGRGCVSFVQDFPACLPSLARRKAENPDLVERVEVFLEGTELGNGFHELADAREQERRFDADIETLQLRGSVPRGKDHRLLAALRSGLPDCSGIALGLDRLLMILTGANDIGEVLSFSFADA